MLNKESPDMVWFKAVGSDQTELGANATSLVLTFTPNDDVPAGAKLVIDCPDDFRVTGIEVGDVDIITGGGTIPASVFRHDSTLNTLKMPKFTAKTPLRVTIVPHAADAAARSVLAAVVPREGNSNAAMIQKRAAATRKVIPKAKKLAKTAKKVASKKRGLVRRAASAAGRGLKSIFSKLWGVGAAADYDAADIERAVIGSLQDELGELEDDLNELGSLADELGAMLDDEDDDE